MLKGFTHAHLACGCRVGFREGVEGSPVTVVVDLAVTVVDATGPGGLGTEGADVDAAVDDVHPGRGAPAHAGTASSVVAVSTVCSSKL